MGSCAAPSAKGDDKFITTDYLQQCLFFDFLIGVLNCQISFHTKNLTSQVPTCVRSCNGMV
ncbi:hypothetical protein D5F98_25030 (plasmid) [Salmonella enterica subsp. enterica serovar Dublin]|nr:hypothetical protein D5F98_25030 [Salmonella enterica subsp. enterica serovar Dublin]